jgi:hypothetical protein
MWEMNTVPRFRMNGVMCLYGMDRITFIGWTSVLVTLVIHYVVNY